MTALRQEQFAAIYVRVSSGEQVENTSLEEQARRCDLVAAGREGLRPVVYREEGVSGTTADNPAWKHLMKDCRAGRVSKVYALNWKRLARTLRSGCRSPRSWSNSASGWWWSRPTLTRPLLQARSCAT